MKAILVKVQCVTNLHVGNGDVNYNIIDNEVERDPVTGLPTINSSGLKGALRQYFTENNQKDDVNSWFGDDNAKTEGALKILSADMMAMPARASEGDKAFYMVSPKSSQERYDQLRKSFAIPETDDFSGEDYTDSTNVAVEGIKVEEKIVVAGDTVYSMSDAEFRMIELPVMARNCLENGISKNLWYEEIVPHHSTFVFPVIVRDDAVDSLRGFKNAIEGKIVQFGGNASIGYGLCSLTTVGEV
ncbi:CRISPR-associated RAMP Cmr4 [Anaerovibrio sp. JC8]|uniref:RAMP superfamily CRISPR-associated protein n=1 Tax=Anaerovibrio sp. JC8 TaxID=1240085 RepID=UPI000A0C97BA|nr:RAMP superfamily CRISPR-associated protein [Anaerovibrio sp. JC8]ORU00265.1 CRISPR-associated RAMP Cmr4 [Anaerovibrio sp. JC8]